MRVCMVTTSFPRWPGDLSGNFVHSLSESLTRLGMEISVVAPGHSQAARHDDWDHITVHRFGYAFPSRLQVLAYDGGIPHKLRTSHLARFEIPPFLLSMYSLVCRVARACDLIHAHWIPTGAVAGMAARRLGIPMVLTVHGSDSAFLRHGRLRAEVSRFSVRSASHVIPVSETLKAELLAFSGAGLPLTKIHSGVDPSVFLPGSGETGGRSILWVGRMTREKGVEYLIRAMKDISIAHPSASLLLVGDGPLRGSLETLARDIGVSEFVSFMGWKDHSEMVSIYAASDIVALPSLSEGLPMVLLEAMASGKPVVATRVGGIPELIDQGGNGYLVAPGSESEIADRVMELLARPELAAQMGTASRALVESSHSWVAVAMRVSSVYASVVGGWTP